VQIDGLQALVDQQAQELNQHKVRTVLSANTETVLLCCVLCFVVLCCVVSCCILLSCVVHCVLLCCFNSFIVFCCAVVAFYFKLLFCFAVIYVKDNTVTENF